MTTLPKPGKIYYCGHDRSYGSGSQHTRGTGTPRVKGCRGCGGHLITETGWHGVYAWRADARYPLGEAVKLYASKAAAEKYADANGLVVRWVETPAEDAPAGEPTPAPEPASELTPAGERIVTTTEPSGNPDSPLIITRSIERDGFLYPIDGHDYETDPASVAHIAQGDVIRYTDRRGNVNTSEVLRAGRDEFGMYFKVIRIDFESDDDGLVWTEQACTINHKIEKVDGPVPGFDPDEYAIEVSAARERQAERDADYERDLERRAEFSARYREELAAYRSRKANKPFWLPAPGAETAGEATGTPVTSEPTNTVPRVNEWGTDCTSTDSRYSKGSARFGSVRHLLRMARAYREQGMGEDAALYLGKAASLRRSIATRPSDDTPELDTIPSSDANVSTHQATTTTKGFDMAGKGKISTTAFCNAPAGSVAILVNVTTDETGTKVTPAIRKTGAVPAVLVSWEMTRNGNDRVRSYLITTNLGTFPLGIMGHASLFLAKDGDQPTTAQAEPTSEPTPAPTTPEPAAKVERTPVDLAELVRAAGEATRAGFRAQTREDAETLFAQARQLITKGRRANPGYLIAGQNGSLTWAGLDAIVTDAESKAPAMREAETTSEPTPAPVVDVTPEPATDDVSAVPAPVVDVTPEPAPAGESTSEPTPAPATVQAPAVTMPELPAGLDDVTTRVMAAMWNAMVSTLTGQAATVTPEPASEPTPAPATVQAPAVTSGPVEMAFTLAQWQTGMPGYKVAKTTAREALKAAGVAFTYAPGEKRSFMVTADATDAPVIAAIIADAVQLDPATVAVPA